MLLFLTLILSVFIFLQEERSRKKAARNARVAANLAEVESVCIQFE